MQHTMIHTSEELRERFKNSVGHRYIRTESGVPSEVDGPGEDDPRDEFLASATHDEIMQVLENEPGVPAPDPEIRTESGVPSEVDGPGEDDPRDEFLASATHDEIMQVLENEPGVPAPDP